MITNFLIKLKRHKFFPLLSAIIFIGICCVQYMAIEVSAHNLIPILRLNLLYKIVGVSTILFFNVLLLLVLKSVHITLNITNILTTVLAVADFYVYKFHGAPFHFDLIKNTATAISVIGGYDIEITFPVIVILASSVAQFVLVNLLFGKVKCNRKFSVVITAVLFVFMIVAYFIPHPIVSKSIVGWSWSEAIDIVGYTPCLVQSTQQSLKAVQKPKRYNEEIFEFVVDNIQVDDTLAETPDIILILNETLYDLNKITETGVDCFEYIDSLDNTISGYAVCPAIGGGTNKSEYELLTSNTLSLAPNITPFNTLKFENENSIAGYLKSLGYTTLVTHPAEPGNYNREKTYPEMGFEKMYFEDEYKNVEFYKDRYFETDSSVYENMFNWYEEMGESPRFIYLLTIQNHGGYMLNSADEAIVKTEKDFGEYTHNVNEFLSCMKLSDDAFEKLVEYYSNVDRDVIVCMVGDHAPDFARNIADEKYSEEDKEILLRSVPYVIWSNNIDLTKYDQKYDITGMVSLVPMLIDAAQIKPSPFYSYIAELNDEVPVLTAYGKYIADNGETYSYDDEGTEFTQNVDIYLTYCYTNMKNK